MNKIEEAKQVLRDAGYYVENMWSTDDIDRVIESYEITLPEGKELTDDEKYDILDQAISCDSVMSDINDNIASEIEYMLDDEQGDEL